MRAINRWLAPPVFPDDEDRTRDARVLSTLLLFAVAVDALACVGVPFFAQKLYTAMGIWVHLMTIASAFWMMRRGRVRLASAIFVSGIWLVFTAFVALSGGVTSIFVVYYFGGTILAALLLGTRAAQIEALACILAGLAMVLADSTGHPLPRIFPVPEVVGWFNLALALVLATAALNVAMKNLQNALARSRQNQTRYTTLFEQAPVMYLTVRREGARAIVSDCNAAFLRTLGLTRGQVIGQPLAQFYSPQCRDAVLGEFRGTLPANNNVPVERELLAQDGRIIPTLLQLAPDMDEAGQNVGIRATYLDITERKRVERLLQALNAAALAMQRALTPDEVFAAVADALKKIGCLCVVFSLDEVKNGLAIRYLGLSSPAVRIAERLLGLRAGSTCFPVDSTEVFRKVVRDRQAVFVEKTEDAIRHQLPTPFNQLAGLLAETLEVPRSAIVPLIVEDEVIGLFSVHAADLLETDLPTITAFANQVAAAWRQAQLFERAQHEIAARRQADEQIRRLNEDLERRVAERTEQLQAANQELEAFAYSVSHDLRAPLRAIDGFTRILVEDHAASLDAEGERVCRVICDNTRRMSRLIDDLLALSRLSRVDLQATSIDMETLAREVFRELTNHDGHPPIDFQVAPLPPAVGDPALVRQVWMNLLSNAIKFSSRRERAIVEVGSEEREGEIAYTVRDNGAGFEIQYADKLFGVFQRLHSEKEFEGTGVGLAIVRRIILRHGGRAWAKGAVDQGATFYFTLPDRRESL